MMRDFRDAKTMARTLRAALAAKGVKITIGQSLEMTAKMFGVADWNTLSAKIRDQTKASSEGRSPRSLPTEILLPLTRANQFARQKQHEYVTLEHLLFVLIDDADAAAAMVFCGVDLGALRTKLASDINIELANLVVDACENPVTTVAVRRVARQAAFNMSRAPAHHATTPSALLLAAILVEQESRACLLLNEQGMYADGIVDLIAPSRG
jgi:Glyoxalase superfamily protein/Clp amino terminal domain, pathogenicity island component